MFQSEPEIALPKRAKRFGVGKEIGGNIYVHERYEHLLGDAVHMAKQHVPRDFRYTVVMVQDDYLGFDVEASKQRSRTWLALEDVDKSRIGRRSFWERMVVPRLDKWSH